MSLRLGFAALCLWLPACSGCSEQKGGSSPLPDADAGVDAVAETGPVADALADTSDEDAPPDSAVTDSDVADGGSAAPIWTLLPGEAAGCPIERLANPEQIRLFTWTPCDGVPDCERAQITDGVLPYGTAYQAWGPACTVSDQSGTVRLGLVQKGLGEVYFAFEDGRVFDGFRRVAGGSCHTGGSAMWGDRYGVPILVYPDGGVRAGGVLHSFGSVASPLLFTLPSFPGGPQATWMGSERWAWWWVQPESLISMSTIDGGDATIFAPTNPLTGPVLALGRATTTGSQFLFQEHFMPEGGPYTDIIAASDGKEPPIAYLTPPADSYYGAVAFAGTHVAWMRGVAPTDTNTFEHVEVWASPYSPNPADLKPEKVGDFPGTHMSASSHTGGHGRYAVAYIAQENPYSIQVLVWDLESKTKQMFQLPPDVIVKLPMGITQKYVWGVGGPVMSAAGDTSWLMRFKVN